eukprot:Seg1120.4 transcript_id=Seg1120.4/GoldUCD/mRNA.D3Y31 product="tRNA selenocysteine 1-associated protein 1" protein_id=Seg1120.4/GoldUCD/D3Y31
MASNTSSLWMGDLEPYMEEMFISSAFLAMGETVVNVKLMKNTSQGTSAGYCFVEFESPTAADAALKKLNGLPVPGTNPTEQDDESGVSEIKRFKLNYAVYGKDHTQGTEYSLYVGDLTANVTDYMLLVYFQARYQSVRAAKVVTDAAGKSKRFGFVRFFDETEHRRALYEMQGAGGLGGKPIKVNAAVQKGQSKPSTDASSYNQYYQQYQQQYQQYLNSYYQQTGVYQQPQQQQQQQQPMGANQYYQQQYNQYYHEPAPDDHELVDPNPEIDVAALNKELIETEKRLYFELEAARWNPLETYASTVPTPKILT